VNGAGLDPATLAAFAAAALVAFLGIVAAHALTGGERRRMKQRIARAAGQAVARHAPEPSSQYASLRRDAPTGRLRSLDAMVHRILPRPQALRERLSRTGRKITLGQYALACVGAALAEALVRPLFVPLAPAAAILVAVVAGLGLPHLVVSFLIKRRLKRFTAQFPDAIDLIVRGLKSGLPTTESIRIVGEEFGDPIGVEFQRISDQVRFGQTLEDALWETAKRLDTAEFRFFCISLSVQRETGGNLGETLENLSDILRKRRQMQLKIRAMSSEAKSSAAILGSLPFIMFVLLYFVNGPYVKQLLTDPRGMTMLGIGLSSLALGVFVMIRMTKFPI
jgi:tight adherence protein B